MKLNETARAALRAADVTPAEWSAYHRMGKTWTGDACGCPDDRCIGSHHERPDDCGCLPVLLEEKWREDAADIARAESLGICPAGECYCGESGAL